jgi:hypothetical protein
LLAGWPSYAEVSPSGRGFRAIGRGTKPGAKCGPENYASGKVEVYGVGTRKYLTFTGHRLPAAAAVITDASDQIARIYAAVFGDENPDERPDRPPGPDPSANGRYTATARNPYAELSDDDLVMLARQAKNGPKFAALFDDGSLARHGDDHSRADLALCVMLAFWCRKDAARVDRLFVRSALYRAEKWNHRHRGDGATYGAMTVEKAVARCRHTYDPDSRAPGTGGAASAEWPPPAVVVLRQWLRDTYEPTFRRGNKLYSARLGREMSVSEVGPASEVLARLQAAADAPRSRDGHTDVSALPYHFRTWIAVAWADLAAGLPEEPESAEVIEPARDEFVRALTAALVTMVPLSYRHGNDGQPEEVQRRPAIEWARMFAKGPKWESVRGYRIWSRKDGGVTRVAIRTELLSQLNARAMTGLSQTAMSKLCVLYGLGQPCKVQGGDARATELTTEFLADLLAGPADPDVRTPEGETHAPACEATSKRPGEGD